MWVFHFLLKDQKSLLRQHFYLFLHWQHALDICISSLKNRILRITCSHYNVCHVSKTHQHLQFGFKECLKKGQSRHILQNVFALNDDMGTCTSWHLKPRDTSESKSKYLGHHIFHEPWSISNIVIIV